VRGCESRSLSDSRSRMRGSRAVNASSTFGRRRGRPRRPGGPLTGRRRRLLGQVHLRRRAGAGGGPARAAGVSGGLHRTPVARDPARGEGRRTTPSPRFPGFPLVSARARPRPTRAAAQRRRGRTGSWRVSAGTRTCNRLDHDLDVRLRRPEFPNRAPVERLGRVVLSQADAEGHRSTAHSKVQTIG
jgi:hypothetical protein